MARYLYSELSSLIQARKTLLAKADTREWINKHESTIESLVSNHLPSGSGFDSGTEIDLDASRADKLVFTTSYHHMDENGFYGGWTEHTVTVTPALSGNFHIRISGRDRNDIKDLIHQVFDAGLRIDVTYDLYAEYVPEFKLRHAWENEDGTASQCYQAWYVGEKRFWNRYSDAREYAGKMMYEKFMTR